MGIAYACALAVSAVALLTMAISGFGVKSTVDRLLCGIGGIGAGWFAYHLFFLYEGGRVAVFWAAFVIPLYAGYRLIQGFRNREADRAQRAAMKAKLAEAEEWRSKARF